jgi:hypothetical protein
VQLGSDGNYFHWDRYTIFVKKSAKTTFRWNQQMQLDRYTRF